MKGRVLVIDNEAGSRNALTFGLTKEGYVVTACPDGISAIRELKSAQENKKPYTGVVTNIFLPDLDVLGMLRAIRSWRPGLPMLVITGFCDEAIKSAILSEPCTACLDQPFELSDLIEALNKLSAESSEKEVKIGAVEDTREPAAYIAVRVTEPDRGLEIFKELSGMDEVKRCDTLRGDFDIIIGARGGGKEIVKLKERISALQGAEIVFASDAERPKLDREIDEFVRACLRTSANPDKQTGRASYIFVNTEKEAIRRVFTAVALSCETVFCDVIEDGAGLVAMVAGRAARIIERLGRTDGVLRVREAAVIRLE
ncbi:MAG: response regulator [Syntrophorhabdaceae bacterium]|nr:response regulator [Syntrophorhabdaceae bacterium]